MILLSVLLMLHDMSYMKYHFTRVISSFNTLIWQRLRESLEMNVFILFWITLIWLKMIMYIVNPFLFFFTPVPRNKNFFLNGINLFQTTVTKSILDYQTDWTMTKINYFHM